MIAMRTIGALVLGLAAIACGPKPPVTPAHKGTAAAATSRPPSLYERATAVAPFQSTTPEYAAFEAKREAAAVELLADACARAQVTCPPHIHDGKPSAAVVAAGTAWAASITNPMGACFVRDQFADGLTIVACPAFESPYGVTWRERCLDPAYPVPVYLPNKEHPNPIACGVTR